MCIASARAAPAGEQCGDAGGAGAGGPVLSGSAGPEQEQPAHPRTRYPQTTGQSTGAAGHR